LPPACDNGVRRARPLLGTFVEITAAAAPGRDVDAIIDAAFGAVAAVHRLMSFHDPDSDVGRLNRYACARAVAVDAWTFEVVQTAIDMHRRSAGIFDVAVAPVLQDLGLLPGPRNGPAPARRAQATDLRRTLATSDCIELLAGERVRFHHPDVAVDGLVNAGGDLAACGADSHTVYIRDPRRPDRLVSRVELRNQALASSGGSLDPFRSSSSGGSAVIDPSTGAPASAIRGASVLAPSCMIADALTKVVMLTGERAGALLAHARASAMFVAQDGDMRASADWQQAPCHAA
jgi:FAD:protein FMN transferase